MLKGTHHSNESKILLSKRNYERYSRGEVFGFQLNHTTNMGSKRSEETREKLSHARRRTVLLKQTDRRVWCSDCGKLLNSSALYCGSKLCKSCVRKGQGTWNYKGGVTPEAKRLRRTLEYQISRNGCFARDSYTCQKCGLRGRVINAHHIKGFAEHPELRTALDNLITF